MGRNEFIDHEWTFWVNVDIDDDVVKVSVPLSEIEVLETFCALEPADAGSSSESDHDDSEACSFIEDDENGENSGDDDGDDTCFACSEGGTLLCCDSCPQAWHARCAGYAREEDVPDEGDWFCPSCTGNDHHLSGVISKWAGGRKRRGGADDSEDLSSHSPSSSSSSEEDMLASIQADKEVRLGEKSARETRPGVPKDAVEGNSKRSKKRRKCIVLDSESSDD